MDTDGWMPIETAPKRGYSLLYNGEIGIGYWFEWSRDQTGNVIGISEDDDDTKYDDRWEWCGEGFKIDPPPTHWMPLPPPPRS